MDSQQVRKYLAKSFVVVEFINELDEDGRKVVDLVPSKWINNSGPVLVCLYPIRSGKKLQEMIKAQVQPQQSWKEHEVKILQGGNTYEQGERRVNRSFTQSMVESTTAGESNTDSDGSDGADEQESVDNNNGKRDGDGLNSTSDGSDYSSPKGQKNSKKINSDRFNADGSAPSQKRKKKSINDSISDGSDYSSSKRQKTLRKVNSNVFNSDGSENGTSSGNSRENSPEKGKKTKKPLNRNLLNVSSKKVTSKKSSIYPSTTNQQLNKKQASTVFGSSNHSSQNDNVFHQILQSDFQDCLKQMEERMTTMITKEIKSAKQSILYDLKKRIELLSQSLLNITGIETTIGKIEEEKKKLDIQLPIRDLEIFKTFDKTVTEDPVKNSAFKSLIQCLLQGTRSLSEGIRSVLPYLIGKEVQLEYTATGRKIKGVGKNNFSDTYTYQCVAAVLCESLQVNHKIVTSKVGKWLSGAADREGGKMDRLRLSL